MSNHWYSIQCAALTWLLYQTVADRLIVDWSLVVAPTICEQFLIPSSVQVHPRVEPDNCIHELTVQLKSSSYSSVQVSLKAALQVAQNWSNLSGVGETVKLANLANLLFSLPSVLMDWAGDRASHRSCWLVPTQLHTEYGEVEGWRTKPPCSNKGIQVRGKCKYMQVSTKCYMLILRHYINRHYKIITKWTKLNNSTCRNK